MHTPQPAPDFGAFLNDWLSGAVLAAREAAREARLDRAEDPEHYTLNGDWHLPPFEEREEPWEEFVWEEHPTEELPEMPLGVPR